MTEKDYKACYSIKIGFISPACEVKKMRVIVSVVFIFLMFGNQISAQDTAKIEVVKFVWNMYVPNTETDSSAQFDPTITRQPQPVNPGSLPRTDRTNRTNEKTIEERSRDLSTVERVARKTGASPPGNIFVYQLKIKNTDTKVVKSFVWEYQPAGETALQTGSSRQFLCVEKIKAGGSETLRIFSHLPPVNVVDASDSKNKSDKNHASEILINRIEYSDGTVWQRPDWDAGAFLLESPRITEKLKTSDCAAL